MRSSPFEIDNRLEDGFFLYFSHTLLRVWVFLVLFKYFFNTTIFNSNLVNGSCNDLTITFVLQDLHEHFNETNYSDVFFFNDKMTSQRGIAQQRSTIWNIAEESTFHSNNSSNVTSLPRNEQAAVIDNCHFVNVLVIGRNVRPKTCLHLNFFQFNFSRNSLDSTS